MRRFWVPCGRVSNPPLHSHPQQCGGFGFRTGGFKTRPYIRIPNNAAVSGSMRAGLKPAPTFACPDNAAVPGSVRAGLKPAPTFACPDNAAVLGSVRAGLKHAPTMPVHFHHAGLKFAYASTSHLLPTSSKFTCTRACAPVPSTSVTKPVPNLGWRTFAPSRIGGASSAAWP